jgi:hypothetical protein
LFQESLNLKWVRIAPESIPSFAASEIKNGSATPPLTFAENKPGKYFQMKGYR